MDLVQFKIEMGLNPPICQGPYNTPQALLSSVKTGSKPRVTSGNLVAIGPPDGDSL